GRFIEVCRRRRHAARHRRRARCRRDRARRRQRPLQRRATAGRRRRLRAHVTRGGPPPMTPLYLLAFDHRSSFSRDLLGIEGTTTRFEARRVAGIKNVVYEGFQLALVDGVPCGSAGLLVDEQYGTRIARSARGEGVVLAMPVEKSGRAEFEFEFGDEF